MAQTSNPRADKQNPGSWTEDGAGTNLYEAIDDHPDTTPTDSCISPASGNNNYFEVYLQAITDPGNGTNDITVASYSTRISGGATVTVGLYGATTGLIGSQQVGPGASPTLDSFTVSSSSINDADWGSDTTLWLRFTQDTNNKQVSVQSAQVTAPDAATGIDAAVDADVPALTSSAASTVLHDASVDADISALTASAAATILAGASTYIYLPDSEFLREPNLLIPKKKPTGAVKIDWSHSLTKNLLCCGIANPCQQQELVTGNAVSAKAGNWAVRDEGIGWQTTTGSVGGYEFPYSKSYNFSSASGVTFWWRGYLDADPTANAGFISNTTGSLGAGEFFFYSWGNNTIVVQTLGGIDNSGSGLLPTSAQPINIFVASDTSSTNFYVNNTLNTDSTPAFFAAMSTLLANPITFNSLFNLSDANTANVLSGVFYIGGFWARKFDSAEVTELRKDPYQFLIPA